MIEISLYRCHIGSFSQVRIHKKFKKFRRQRYQNQEFGRRTLSALQFCLKLVLFISLLPLQWYSAPSDHPVKCPGQSQSQPISLLVPFIQLISDLQLVQNLQPAGLNTVPSHKTRPNCFRGCSESVLQFQTRGRKQTSNFIAKYTYGNRNTSRKGIVNLHFNIRSLSNKIVEVKNIVKQHNPHILGLSESELRGDSNQFDESKLKIPGYNILFPKSWASQGKARVIVYVKKSLEFEQLDDIEEEDVQSVWIRGGYKKGKKIYFCHGYREHKSNLGGSLSAQKSNLESFLAQWEAALSHNNPAEPNEIHVCCDMNLDCLGGKWLSSDYPLVSLSRLVQSCCNVNNLFQLVAAPTRLQYNSVQNTTEISCIDHAYTNVKHRCSGITVTSAGCSDHDIISYVRYSKEPPSPARTIRKRSYKNFKQEKYLEDLETVDWTDVLACGDVDTANDIFTRKLQSILNFHAPWIVFQQRKFFSPWLTEETKILMEQRDKLKLSAKNLALRDQALGITSEDQKSTWAQFKQLRNRINNVKKNEEHRYKSSKILQDLDSPAKTWSTAKNFMEWKTTGTPKQLEINSCLITKASQIAKHMNEFFLGKVHNIRRNLNRGAENLSMCLNIMQGKTCSLSLQHVTVKKVKALLKELKSSKSTSVDELDNYSVKLAAEHIAAPLHHIITLSIMQEKFPAGWKYTKVIPLHKKLSQLEPKNYRPVAILSPLSKILEKIAYQQIYDYFSLNKLFHPNLHGYQKNRSTQTALLQLYDRWIKAAARDRSVV